MTLKQDMYREISRFLQALKDQDGTLLEKEYGLTNAVFREIISILEEDYEVDIHSLTFVPINQMEVFELNEKNSYGIECKMLEQGRLTGLTFMAHYYLDNDKFPKLEYRLIEVM